MSSIPWVAQEIAMVIQKRWSRMKKKRNILFEIVRSNRNVKKSFISKCLAVVSLYSCWHMYARLDEVGNRISTTAWTQIRLLPQVQLSLGGRKVLIQFLKWGRDCAYRHVAHIAWITNEITKARSQLNRSQTSMGDKQLMRVRSCGRGHHR